MKITTDTPDLLIVEDRPILLGLGLIVFIMIFVGIGIGLMLSGEGWGITFTLIGGGMGFLAFWAFVRRVQVVFHRPENWVEFRRKNIFSGSRVRHDLSEISRAEIESSQGSEGGTTYRVVLVFDRGQSAGRHPITLAYTSSASHHLIQAKINDWLGVSA
jgi:hypothetical protein